MNRPEVPTVSSFVSSQVPEYIRSDHPAFIAFVEAYYEWLESDYSPVRIDQIRDVSDIDNTIDLFVDSFKAQYLKDFPNELAIDPTRGEVNSRMLIKNIRDFYESKGTENSYRLLFQVLYGAAVEFYYPRTDILQASGGRWVQEKSIKITRNTGNAIFTLPTKEIRQIDPTTNTVKAYARVNRTNFYREGQFEVAELFINNVTGSFDPGFPVSYDVEGLERPLLETTTYEIVTSVGISTASVSAGHEVGERLAASGGSGEGFKAVVDRVDSSGAVRRVRIIDFGVGYNEPPTLSLPLSVEEQILAESFLANSGITQSNGNYATLFTSITSGANQIFGTVFTTRTGAVANYPGFYADRNGHLSSTKRLQDNRYYQNYSYVLKSELTIDRYRDDVKRIIHPAGLAFFGSVMIDRCRETDIKKRSTVTPFEIPIIGHYTPYSMDETEDLSVVYPNGYPEGSPYGTNDGDPRRDPFYRIYSHPNTRGIDGITEGSRFGDILIESFFEMPVNGAEAFVCQD